MDIKEFAPRHGTYIDYLKEQERLISIQLGAAIADINQHQHFGFCMAIYDNTCPDCPTHKECTELYSKDMGKYKRRVDTLGMMKDIISDAIDREKI